MKKNIKFDLYRFQIIPKDRHFQASLFSNIQSLEDLISKKNEILFQIIKDMNNLKTKSGEIKSAIEYQSDDLILYKFAPKKHVIVETKEFKDEKIEDWPSFHVFFWNQPDKQIIAIEERRKAFQKTKTVNNIIMDNINNILKNKNLIIFSEPIFNKKDFWSIINSHKHHILNIKFDLITPNMANIANVLSQDLKNLAKTTNTATTTLKLDANKDTTLDIDDSNEYVDDIVSYASNGGGNISIKIKGFKRRVHTSENITTIEIDELKLKNSASMEAFKNLMDDIL